VVIGGSAHRNVTQAEFEAYAPFVPVGSYVVVTDTVVNGNPVWAGFGPGPFEAVRLILGQHGEFATDYEPERYSLTFNPGGFLKRTR
jgi:cephalosporin hydroxylase